MEMRAITQISPAIEPTVENGNGRIRTLIVDDSPPILKHLHQFVDGYDCMKVIGEAASGLEAIRMMKQYKPQLVLMDLEMEGMDGLQATQLINSYYPDTRVIIIAIHESAEVEATCLAHGADAFITKSKIHKNLIGLVSRLFDSE
jgi:two-component system NarL family response regulator